jgi:PAS domain S-box-containing protein
LSCILYSNMPYSNQLGDNNLAETNQKLLAKIEHLQGLLAISEAKCRALEHQTEELPARVAMQSELNQLMLALDSAQMGWWDLDWATQKAIWSPQHERILGYEPGQPDRHYADWACRVHPDDLDRIQQSIDRAKNQGEDLAEQYRLIWPDGSLHWVNSLGRVFHDASGNPVRMMGVIREITAAKQAEQALRESEEKFRATFEQAAVGIAHVDPQGRWLRMNQKLCDIVGYSPEELQEITFQDITHPDDLEADLTYVRQLLANEIQTYSMEKRYIHKQGTVVWAELTVSLVRESLPPDRDSEVTELGAPRYFIAVVEEIGDRKRAEAALQVRARELSEANVLLAQATTTLKRRNQELDQFVYIVSHDLKAPLRGIANLSEWIETDLEGQLPPENQQQLRLLRTRADRMGAMIDGLLNYSRASWAEAATEAVEVSELLSEVIDSLNPPPSFRIQMVSAMPTLQTKRLLLSQVFANLISNAIKHHDRPEGSLSISAQAKGNFYEFALQDNGPGIAPEDHDKIFMIFQTLNLDKNQQNTGVGLSIVKKIVETEGGTIRLESQLQQGTTFYFTWPKPKS